MIGFFSILRGTNMVGKIHVQMSSKHCAVGMIKTGQGGSQCSYSAISCVCTWKKKSCDMSIDVLDRKTRLCMFSIAIGLLMSGFSSSTVSSRWCCVLPVRCHQTLQKKRAERGRELQMPGGPVCCSFSPITECMFVLWTDSLNVLYQSTLALCYLSLLLPQLHTFFCRVEGGSCSYLFPHFVLCS